MGKIDSFAEYAMNVRKVIVISTASHLFSFRLEMCRLITFNTDPCWWACFEKSSNMKREGISSQRKTNKQKKQANRWTNKQTKKGSTGVTQETHRWLCYCCHRISSKMCLRLRFSPLETIFRANSTDRYILHHHISPTKEIHWTDSEILVRTRGLCVVFFSSFQVRNGGIHCGI